MHCCDICVNYPCDNYQTCEIYQDYKKDPEDWKRRYKKYLEENEDGK